MRRLWIHRTIDAPSETMWQLLTDPAAWPVWGPTVRRADIDDEHFGLGSTGSVTSVGGVTLPFRVTEFDDGRRWAWQVGGVDATDHSVEPLGPDRCRVGFGVPWPIAPYLAVCRVALDRLEVAAVRTDCPDDGI